MMCSYLLFRYGKVMRARSKFASDGNLLAMDHIAWDEAVPCYSLKRTVVGLRVEILGLRRCKDRMNMTTEGLLYKFDLVFDDIEDKAAGLDLRGKELTYESVRSACTRQFSANYNKA